MDEETERRVLIDLFSRLPIDRQRQLLLSEHNHRELSRLTLDVWRLIAFRSPDLITYVRFRSICKALRGVLPPVGDERVTNAIVKPAIERFVWFFNFTFGPYDGPEDLDKQRKKDTKLKLVARPDIFVNLHTGDLSTSTRPFYVRTSVFAQWMPHFTEQGEWRQFGKTMPMDLRKKMVETNKKRKTK